MKRQRDVATAEISRTEDGVWRTSWDVRPGREGSSSEVPRRCGERARDGLHNKSIKSVFLWRVVVSGRKFKADFTRFYSLSPLSDLWLGDVIGTGPPRRIRRRHTEPVRRPSQKLYPDHPSLVR